HGLGQVLADREAQAGSRDLGQPGLRTAIEGLENVLQLRAVDTYTAILDRDGDLFARFCCLYSGGDANAAIASAVLNGVCYQIFEASAHSKKIARDTREVWLDILLNDTGFLDDHRGDVFANLLQDRRDLKRANVVTIFAAADGGEQQNAIDVVHEL